MQRYKLSKLQSITQLGCWLDVTVIACIAQRGDRVHHDVCGLQPRRPRGLQRVHRPLPQPSQGHRLQRGRAPHQPVGAHAQRPAVSVRRGR